MIREARKFTDVQKVLVAMLRQLSTTGQPWSDWEVVTGWPGRQLATLSRPVIYVLMPQSDTWLAHFGGGLAFEYMSCTIGAWDDRKTGGPEEIGVITSELSRLFRDPRMWSARRFSVTLGTREYANVGLTDMGIRVRWVEGPREMMVEDEDEFRSELVLHISAGG